VNNMKSLLTLIIGLMGMGFVFAERVEHGECYAEWNEKELVVGNGLVERKWKMEGGLLTAVSLKDKASGKEWLRQAGRQAAPHVGEGVFLKEERKLVFTSKVGKRSAVEAESLVVELQAAGGKQSFGYRFQVFAGTAGVTMWFSGDGGGADDVADGEKKKPDGIEGGGVVEEKRGGAVEALEDFMLSPKHLKYTLVEMTDQTDHHDELVFEKEWLPMMDAFEGKCNVFYVEEVGSGDGLAFLKLAPLPHARPNKSAWDVKVAGAGRRLMFGGLGYEWTVMPYVGGRAGRIAAMQDYQRCLREYVPGRDGLFLSNTWGDRSRDARVSEEFLMKEIEAGARLGVDVVQVDDGWQKGMTGNSAQGRGAWGNFREGDPDFWEPHPERFSRGLKPLADAARERGMKFGLWFGPDKSNDMEHWELDAGVVLDAFKKDGITSVKIDAVEMLSPLAEENLKKFYGKVLEESGGQVSFETDVTAGFRPGYFGTVGVGVVFVENRYTDWGNYWPHRTLRNLWTLGQHVDPVRLRMEFLNNQRNKDKYEGDALAPEKYAPDALFAMVMFSSPLGWFETSNLPEEYFEKVAPLVGKWKEEREAIFSGHVIPIGEAPDGHVWTGFCSTAKDRKSARLVIFREMNDEATWTTRVPLLDGGGVEAKVLGGNGTAHFRDGELVVTIPETLGYVFLKIEADEADLLRLEGKLSAGIVAIGGETTGWKLDYVEDGKKMSIEVDMSGIEVAGVYDGKEVSVSGRIVVKEYVERGAVKVLEAKEVLLEQ
jgi:alpha-galactosidase